MDYKPLSGREYPRYSGIKTFFRLPIAKLSDKFDVALFGIPFDGGVSYRPGARFAPAKVRETSSLSRGFHLQRELQVFETIKCADMGDCPTVPIDLEQSYKKIQEFVSQVLKSKKKFLACGGDHSTTLPVLRSLRKYYGVPLALIHFDAHLDTYPAAWDCEYHHGSFLRHAIQEKLIDPSKIIQIGIRGPFAGEDDLDFIKKHKIKYFTIDDLRQKDIHQFIGRLPRLTNTPTYLTFDVDCLDPVYAPGTGTPVVGGMTTYEVQQILRSLKIPNLVGGDVVEICPAYDHADLTALVGVDVLFEMLCLLAKSKS